MSRILDRRFKYVSAAATDVRKTFRRVQAEIRAKEKAEQERKAAIEAEAQAKTITLKRSTK